MKRGDILTRAVAVVALVAATAGVGCNNNKSDGVSGTARDDRSAGRESGGGVVHSGSGARYDRMAERAPVDTTNRWEVDERRALPKSPLRGEASRGGCIPAGMASSSVAFPTGDPDTSALVVAKGLPTQVVRGQEFEYIICVTNVTSNDLDSVTLTDELSRGFEIVSSNPSYSDQSGQSYTWDLGTLAAGETQAVNIRARAEADDSISSCASVTYESAVCVAAQVVQPALRLVKTGPAEVMACDEFTYTIRVTNTGTGAAQNVVITEQLAEGLTSQSGRNDIRIALDRPLGPGETREFTIPVQASRTGRFENTARVTAEPGLDASSETVSTVVRQPVLEIAQRCDEVMFLGRTADMDITVTNTGDGIARNTVVEATLPPGVSFVSASDNARPSGNRVAWSIGDLAPEATKRVNVAFSSTEAGTFRSTATATAVCADAVTTEECATEYRGIPAILVECIDLEDPDEVGTNETYVITITNQGTAPDTNIRLVCEIPDAMSYVSSTGPTEASSRGQTVTFAPLPDLAPKAEAVWRVVVRANEPGDVRFEIHVTSDQFRDPPIMETESTTLYE